ncbi:hypothetical protein BDM02DRAFT_3107597 [Thelephora ganbajun]|uniref:Uncharacterized protein n=1 Tax=Thelephora ganbajun TaxID=370292 RepID=A0ACB6ZVS9_THEGA|nr:hypothetical protein BDM02DRAFT_3107597 [Thelephora ganbajun]
MVLRHMHHQEPLTFLEIQNGPKLVLQLQPNPAGQKTLLIVQMMSVGALSMLACRGVTLMTYRSRRICIRDWERSPHRGPATAKFARGA